VPAGAGLLPITAEELSELRSAVEEERVGDADRIIDRLAESGEFAGMDALDQVSDLILMSDFRGAVKLLDGLSAREARGRAAEVPEASRLAADTEVAGPPESREAGAPPESAKDVAAEVTAAEAPFVAAAAEAPAAAEASVAEAEEEAEAVPEAVAADAGEPMELSDDRKPVGGGEAAAFSAEDIIELKNAVEEGRVGDADRIIDRISESGNGNDIVVLDQVSDLILMSDYQGAIKLLEGLSARGGTE
jgi:thioredoxin-like negative regulator of GroEL